MKLRAIGRGLLSKLRQLQRNYSDNAQRSFAQCGEDLILQHLFMVLGIKPVRYLDIGAHHPTYLSNTWLFYQQGYRGVCVEPDPALFREFSKKRPRDTNLNCGVGVEAGEADFFVMSTPTLNTFSIADAERYQARGQHRITKTIRLKLNTVNDIVAQHFADSPSKAPNLVSLDVEGLDYAILQSFDFAAYRPEVFCLETLTFTEDKSQRKLTEIIELMQGHGYMVYADTYINTIFVDAAVWRKRP
jgi:FkbM family methyltransferase